MILRLFISILALLQLPISFAIDDDIVTVLKTSSSTRTIYLNRGRGDLVKNGDLGVLVTKEKLSIGKVVYKPVAKLKAVRVTDSTSIWIAYDVLIKDVIEQNKKFILLSEQSMLRGRNSLTVERKNIVLNKKEDLKDFLLEGDSLAKKDYEYEVIEKAHEKEEHYNKDMELIDISKWERKLGDDKLFVKGIYKSPYAEDFNKRVRVRTFEKMVVAYLNKYNDVNFDYESFYKEQARNESTNLPDSSIFQSYKKKYEIRKLDQIESDKKFYDSVTKNGETWSERYTDKELSEILNNVSIVRERQRRINLVAFKYDYQGTLSMGLNIINNENLNDSETTEQSKYSTEVSIEGYFFSEIEDLEYLTIEFSGRRALDAYFGGDLNVKSVEYSLAAQINYYPFKRPSAINTPVFYVGLLTRYGLSRATNNTTEEEGNYQIVTLPGFRTGLKWHLDNTYGFRIMTGFENINSERLQKSEDSNASLPDRASYSDARVSIGLSKFF